MTAHYLPDRNGRLMTKKLIILFVLCGLAFGAIDSAIDRKAAQQSIFVSPPVADGTIDSQDRAALQGFYLATASASADDITFDGSTDLTWGTAANWTPERVPTGTDNAVIPAGVTITVGAATIDCATISSGASTGGSSGGAIIGTGKDFR